ncbi:MAG: hypothetical protein N2645_09335 [Clostridia bacterium]|nr:hypothetical protein [Clostridia bacterium]
MFFDILKIGRGIVRVAKGVVMDEEEDLARGVKDIATGGARILLGKEAPEEEDLGSDEL